jgi:two-component system NtrC family sensor kinase
MAAPVLLSDHAGLRVLARVAAILAEGLPLAEALRAVTAELRRGLVMRHCRMWWRVPDGAGYTPVTVAGETPELGGTPPIVEWASRGSVSEATPDGLLLRLPLVHDEQVLGAIEALLPGGAEDAVAHDVLVTVAGILSSYVAATELSQDLASEVALRTREVEAQRSFAAKIIDSLPVGLYVIDRAYRIRAWNRNRETGTQGVSREDALGREVFEVLDRQPRTLLQDEFDRVFETGEIQQVEMESLASGDSKHYRITKIPMRMDDEHISHVIAIGEDITAWNQAQHRLAQAEKLAALGQLAAGVMHEINNPLATILACSEALAHRIDELPPGDRQSVEEYLRIIDAEVQRCRRIVDGLLDFSHAKPGTARRLDVNQVVDQTLFLLKYHARFKRLTVIRELTPDLPRVNADPERLIQAFMALMLNAMDAMNSRGTLTVRSGTNPDRRDELLIEFIDQGTGIPAKDLPKIFEPFYTTKPQGRGTGLGLSICYGIIAELRGRIEVESQVGVGSDFKVYLPVS